MMVCRVTTGADPQPPNVYLYTFGPPNFTGSRTSSVCLGEGSIDMPSTETVTPSATPKAPGYRKQKRKGKPALAFVEIDRQRTYLGPYNSAASRAKHAAIV